MCFFRNLINRWVLKYPRSSNWDLDSSVLNGSQYKDTWKYIKDV